MDAVIKLKDPGKIKATIELTMTLDEWKKVRDGLSAAPFYGPTHWLRDAIDRLAKTGRLHVGISEPDEPEGEEATS